LPERITVYRQLRTDEVAVMQPVADALQVQFPDVSEEMLKRALQNGMLALRYAAMAMLMDTPTFVTKRLQTWLPEMVAAYGTGDIDQALHQLLQKTVDPPPHWRAVGAVKSCVGGSDGASRPHCLRCRI
jgi:hypothetical protein